MDPSLPAEPGEPRAPAGPLGPGAPRSPGNPRSPWVRKKRVLDHYTNTRCEEDFGLGMCGHFSILLQVLTLDPAGPGAPASPGAPFNRQRRQIGIVSHLFICNEEVPVALDDGW